MNSVPDAMILCGGLGTRLRSLYADVPKALVPVNGRPFIEYTIEGLLRQGVRRIHLAAGYRASQIATWADSFQRAGVRLTVSVEPSPLGTAGGIAFAMPHLNAGQPMLVLNGDSLLPRARIADLMEARRRDPGIVVWITAVEMTERGQYGTLEIGDADRITAFREKADNNRGWVNGGIYLMTGDVLADIAPGTVCSIEKDIFPGLAATNRLGAVRVEGPLLDMGTPDGLARTASYLQNNNG